MDAITVQTLADTGSANAMGLHCRLAAAVWSGPCWGLMFKAAYFVFLRRTRLGCDGGLRMRGVFEAEDADGASALPLVVEAAVADCKLVCIQAAPAHGGHVLAALLTHKLPQRQQRALSGPAGRWAGAAAEAASDRA